MAVILRWRRGSKDYLTFEEIKRIIDRRVTYKPGSAITVTPRCTTADPSHNGIHQYGQSCKIDPFKAALSIGVLSRDNRKWGPAHPDDGINYTVNRRFVQVRDFAELQAELWDMVRDLEQHEADEWFWVDGEIPYDPHALST